MGTDILAGMKKKQGPLRPRMALGRDSEVKWRIMGMGGDVRGKKGTRVDTSCPCFCSCHNLL